MTAVPGIGEQLALIADQAAGRRVEHQPLPWPPEGRISISSALRFAHLLHDHAGMFLSTSITTSSIGSVQSPGVFVLFQHDARTPIPTAQSLRGAWSRSGCELQLAASGDFHRVAVIIREPPAPHSFGFTQQPVADHAASDLVPSVPAMENR